MRRLPIIIALSALTYLSAAPTLLSQEGIAYQYRLEGLNVDLPNLNKQLMLAKLKDTPPSTEASLARLAAIDADMIKKELAAKGYFAAKVRSQIQTSESPAQVIVHVETGPAYTLNSVNVNWIGDHTSRGREILSYEKEQVYQDSLQKTITPNLTGNIETSILTTLQQHGFPYPEISNRQLTLHHDKHQAHLDLTVDTGPEGVFGQTTIKGHETVETDFIRRRIAWQDGQTYEKSFVDTTQKDLLSSGVIGNASIELDSTDTDPTVLTPTIDISESLHRSFSAGAYISSDVGPYSRLQWEHRNFFGSAERLRLSTDLGTERYGISADLKHPDIFNRRRLSFSTNISHLYEDLEAYESDTSSVTGALSWQVNPYLSLTGGSALEYTDITENDGDQENYKLVSFPVGALYDRSNDLLDPSVGYRLGARFIPTQSIDTNLSFVHTEYYGSVYLPVTDNLVWANRAKLAYITGAQTDEIPADKRLYAGGGGSIRGYGYQLLGPRDDNGDPTGGRMLTEFSTELRYKFTQNLGAVTFLEAGRVSQSQDVTQQNGDYKWATGAGVRYHTPIGPLRFDIALPLNKDRGDDAFQFYISIGQAF